MPIVVRCLLWILMAALPLQGSAAILAACAGLAPASAVASASNLASAPADHGCHEQAAPDGAPAHDESKQPPHGKCSTCASCCTAATAPPHAALPPASFPRAARALPAPEPAIAAIFPAGLERPPRAR